MKINFIKIIIAVPVVIIISIFVFSFIQDSEDVDADSIYDTVDYYRTGMGTDNVYKLQAVTQQDVKEMTTGVAGVSGSSATALSCTYGDLIVKYATETGFDPVWIASIIAQESNFEPDCQSSVGARGLMQVMYNSVEDLARVGYINENVGTVYNNLVDPETGIRIGCLEMKEQRDVYGAQNADELCVSYNAGCGYIKKYRSGGLSSLPSETQHYVRQVAARYEAYKNGSLEIGKRGNF